MIPKVRKLGVYAGDNLALKALEAIKNAYQNSSILEPYWVLENEKINLTNGNIEALILKCVQTNARLVLSAKSFNSSDTTSDILCSYHPDKNYEDDSDINIDVNSISPSRNSKLTPNGSNVVNFSGGNATYHLNENVYGLKLSNSPNLDSGYIIELEDAITIVFFRRSTATIDGNILNHWCMSCHAGLIITPENLSDSALGVDGSGIICGFYAPSSSGNYYWLSSASNNSIRSGLSDWSDSRAINIYPALGTNYTASGPPQLYPIGDQTSIDSKIERLAPLLIRISNSSTLGSTRYIRQRFLIANTTGVVAPYTLTRKNLKEKSGINDVILNTKLISEVSDVAWIHQTSFGASATVMQNLVHIFDKNFVI